MSYFNFIFLVFAYVTNMVDKLYFSFGLEKQVLTDMALVVAVSVINFVLIVVFDSFNFTRSKCPSLLMLRVVRCAL